MRKVQGLFLYLQFNYRWSNRMELRKSMKKSVFYYFFSELKGEKGFYFWNFISYCVLIGITVFIGLGILMIVFKKSDRELVIAAMSPLSIIVPAAFSLVISQVVTLMVLKRFWKQPVIALLR